MSLALSKIATFAPDKQTVNNHNVDILIYFNIFSTYDLYDISKNSVIFNMSHMCIL